MRIATWNVNSLNKRMPRVEEWLDYAKPDVLCLQETKLSDANFPAMAFAALGYEAAHCGQGQWNGVAVLSRVGLDDVVAGFSDQADDEVTEARLLWATCNGVRVVSVYVPNGRLVGSEHYEAKLVWLERLRRGLDMACDPAELLIICGDFNVAPEDRDVWDPAKVNGGTHVSEPERAASRSGASSTSFAGCTTMTGSTATGTTGPATSTSTAACASTCSSPPSRWPTRPRSLSSIALRGRARARRTTRLCWSTSTCSYCSSVRSFASPVPSTSRSSARGKPISACSCFIVRGC